MISSSNRNPLHKTKRITLCQPKVDIKVIPIVKWVASLDNIFPLYSCEGGKLEHWTDCRIDAQSYVMFMFRIMGNGLISLHLICNAVEEANARLGYNGLSVTFSAAGEPNVMCINMISAKERDLFIKIIKLKTFSCPTQAKYKAILQEYGFGVLKARLEENMMNHLARPLIYHPPYFIHNLESSGLFSNMTNPEQMAVHVKMKQATGNTNTIDPIFKVRKAKNVRSSHKLRA